MSAMASWIDNNDSLTVEIAHLRRRQLEDFITWCQATLRVLTRLIRTLEESNRAWKEFDDRDSGYFLSLNGSTTMPESGFLSVKAIEKSFADLRQMQSELEYIRGNFATDCNASYEMYSRNVSGTKPSRPGLTLTERQFNHLISVQNLNSNYAALRLSDDVRLLAYLSVVIRLVPSPTLGKNSVN